jgi:hypothetical protein
VKVLKIALVIFAGIAVLSLGSCILAVGYVTSTPEVAMSKEDIKIGGNYPEMEKVALTTACKTAFGASPKVNAVTFCGCFATRAGEDMSRFERVLTTKVFEGDMRGIIGVTRGMMSTNMSAEDIEAMPKQTDVEARMRDVTEACGGPKMAAR